MDVNAASCLYFFNSGIEGVAESRFYSCVTALTMVVGISAGREHGQLFVFFNSGTEGVAE